jgi:hypothetical protein
MILCKFRLFALAILSFLLFSTTETKAQAGKLPPFRMMQPSGKVFKAENLPFEKPIVLIYFSPDCDDCLKFIDELFKEIDSFKEASLVMISFLPVGEITKFANDYKIKNQCRLVNVTYGRVDFIGIC